LTNYVGELGPERRIVRLEVRQNIDEILWVGSRAVAQHVLATLIAE
jgi:hypothetical protein